MYDLVIKGGTVVDGTNSEPYTSDLMIKDGKIADIGNFSGEAKEVINATGKIVSPGFIDIHTHSDSAPLKSHLCDCKIQQGVTTEITGNCGKSNLPATKERLDEINQYIGSKVNKFARLSISDYAEEINQRGHLTNTGSLIGHGTLRIAVMGFEYRNPTEEEMVKLEDLLERELDRGAFGMSLGLIYPPSAFSEREELLRLAKVLAKKDRILAVHMRNEGPRIFEAVDEMLSIAKESGVHLEISHLKLMGKPQWGKSAELIKKIENARKQGVNVNCDQYPFLASSTNLTATLPHWAHEGGNTEIIKRCQNPTEKMLAETRTKIEERGGAETIFIVNPRLHPEYAGKYLSEVAENYNLPPEEAAVKVIAENEASASCCYFCINEQDMLNIMPKDYICVGSDGVATSYEDKYVKVNLHPRNYGTFPQFFQTVREHNLLPIKTAVYKCTGLPASVLGLKDRGVLKVGTAADITVFDKETIKNNSTFMDAKQKPDGIEYVIIEGKIALEHKCVKLDNCGKVLLHD